jgi:hypothetical protein
MYGDPLERTGNESKAGYQKSGRPDKQLKHHLVGVHEW